MAMNVKRIVAIGGCAPLIFAPSQLMAQQKQANKQKGPNVIYIFPDQMRNCAMAFWCEKPYRDSINFMSDPVQTPNLNRFAQESMVLTSAMSNFPLAGSYR